MLHCQAKMTLINYHCLSPHPILLQHKHKNSLAMDRIDLPGKHRPQKRLDFQTHQFTAPLYFTATVMPILQIRVRCAVSSNLSQLSTAKIQANLNHEGTLPLSPKAVYVETQDTRDFHSSLKRYILAWSTSTLEVCIKLSKVLAIVANPQQSCFRRITLPSNSVLPHIILFATHNHLLKPY